MYLLDTNIVSELRRKSPHKGLISWFTSVSHTSIHLSAVTLGEIQSGIEQTREKDAAKAVEIEQWLNSLPAMFNVLPMDEHAFRKWAVLMQHKSDDLSEDAMIAAMALTHGLTLVSRNVGDFTLLGVPVFNPFEWQ